jgi:cysteine-rich repeat protein
MNVMRTALLVALLVPLPLVLAAPAGATEAKDICALADDPCLVKVVKNGVAVEPGSTLDFGTRTLRIPPGAQLIVTGTAGSMTVMAGAVDIRATGQGAGLMRAVGGTISVTAATGDVNVRKVGNSVGRIDVSGPPTSGGGGTIDLEATAGNVLVDGVLDAGANANDASGGSVSLTGLTVAIGSASEIDLAGKNDGGGGTLTIDAASNVTLGGKIAATGGFFGGGEIDVDAGGSVVSSANIDLQSAQAGGDGGAFDIGDLDPVGGPVTLGGSVDLSGDTDSDFSGSGGELDIESHGSILITAPVNASSGDGGSGGVVNCLSELDITQSAPIQVQGKGAEGDGGTASFEAHRALVMAGVDASGSAFNSGEIDGTAWCSLNLPAGRTLESSDGGSNFLASGGTMTINGSLRAINGTNELDYLNTVPVVTGVVNPPTPGVKQDTTLTPCGGGPPTCGNGKKDGSEACDGTDSTCPTGQQCTPACTCAVPPMCGDGNVDPGEQCDDKNKTNGDGCDNNCTPTGCGNGIKTGNEQCDDGNMVAGDGCSPGCTSEECGNRQLDPGEQCDDGPAGSATCTSNCQLMPPATCGNGTVDDGETCDDHNQTDCDGCSRFCLLECGDGKTACNEQCDDGNTDSNDGCSSTCQTEFCGDHVVQVSEECDDGAQNGTLGDACSPTCTLHWCGDGHVDSGEQCDDANTNECDGCKSDCTAQTVACPICSAGATEPCIPCTDVSDCDPMRACGSTACVAGVCTPTTPPTCDDGNPCTNDSCDPGRGCVQTPKTCEDGDACDGVSTCYPSSGACLPGTAPDCDDHDECTDDDRCVGAGAGFQCTTTPRTGAAMATCRLAAIDQLLSSADIKKSTRNKLSKLVKLVRKRLPAAAGSGKKAARALKQANNALLSLNRVVAKAGKKIAPDTAASLREAISKAATAVASL